QNAGTPHGRRSLADVLVKAIKKAPSVAGGLSQEGVENALQPTRCSTPPPWCETLQYEACQARLIFSSILKTPLGAFLKRRLKFLPRQRRSRVLRRTRLRSAI